MRPADFTPGAFGETLDAGCDLFQVLIDPAGPARQDGRIAPPEGPGLGILPDPEVLGEPMTVYE